MGRLNNLDAIATIDSSTSTATTPSYESTSAPDNQLYNYTQNQQDYDNPYQTNSANNNSEANDQAQNTTPTETPTEPTQQPTQEQQPQQSFAQESLNNVLTQNGVTADEWSRITSPNFDIQGLMASTAPEAQKYRNAYMAYQNMMQAPAQAPAQQTPAQNPILPSAGGNYQADSIYDPSKTYGRQADGSYVYSNSAAQLQRDLNRVMDAGLTVDGYFGEKTQQALDAYLSQYGKPTGSAKGDESYKMYDAPIGPALPPQTTPATTQTPVTTPTPEPTSAPAALAASAAEAPAATETPAPAQTPEQSVYQPKPLSNSNTLNDEHFLRYYQSGMDTVDKAYNSMLKSKPGDTKTAEWYADAFADWLNRGGPEATYTSRAQKDAIEESGRSMDKYYRDLLGLQNQPEIGGTEPDSTETQHGEPINYAAMLDELNQMDRNDWYQRPENQTQTAQPEREPINYYAMADELAQLERNDWYQRPETQPASDVPTSSRGLGGRPMGYQRPETPYSFEEDNQEPTARFGDTAFAQGAKDIAEIFTSGTPFMWGDQPLFGPKEPTQSEQSHPIEYSDAFIRQQDMNDAYSPRQTYNNNYRAELERIQNGGIASDDVQAPATPTGTATSEEQAMRDAYANAMQSAGRARDIFNGLPTEAEQMQQAREQREQNMRTALENQFNNPYMQQFQRDFDQLKRQFPNYSDTALMDMVLVNEEMRNGQSSYYKWLANSL